MGRGGGGELGARWIVARGRCAGGTANIRTITSRCSREQEPTASLKLHLNISAHASHARPCAPAAQCTYAISRSDFRSPGIMLLAPGSLHRRPRRSVPPRIYVKNHLCVQPSWLLIPVNRRENLRIIINRLLSIADHASDDAGVYI